MLRSLAGIVGAGLIIAAVGARERHWRALWRTPLVWPVLMLTVAYGLATGLSIAPRISFWGAYLRQQGCYTWLSYVGVYFAILLLVRRRDQIECTVTAIVLASVPPAAYALLQHAGVDPFHWDPGGDRRGRVIGTAGNSVFLGGFLIMVVPLTLARLVECLEPAAARTFRSPRRRAVAVGVYALLLLLQLSALFYTQSRGPQVGLGIGLAVFAVILALRYRRRRWLWGTVGLTIAATAGLLLLNLAHGPLQRLRALPYVGDLGRVFDVDSGTGKVRALIWEGTLHLVAANPWRAVFGYGPDTMPLAYEPFYPPALAHVESSDVTPDRAHNDLLDALIATGIIGAAASLAFFVALFRRLLEWLDVIGNRHRREWFFAALGLGATVGGSVPIFVDGSLRFSAIGLAAGLVAALVIYLIAGVAIHLRRTETAPRADRLLLGALLAAVVAHFVEIHLGIAVASTRLYCLAYAALATVEGTQRRVASEPVPPAHGDVLGGLVGLMLITLTFEFWQPPSDPSTFVLISAGLWFSAAALVVTTPATVPIDRPLRRFATFSLTPWLLFVVVYAGWPARDAPLTQPIADSASLYYGFVFLAVGIGGLLATRVEPWREPAGESPARLRPMLLGVILLAAALWLVHTNLAAVRADRLVARGSSAESHAQWDAAAALYEAALDLQPTEASYAIRLGRVRAEQARATLPEARQEREIYLGQGLATLQQARRRNPLDPQPLRELARLQRLWAGASDDVASRAEHFRHADRLYGQAVEQSPQHAALWNEWATLDLDREQPTAALAKLARSIAVDPDNVLAYCVRGDMSMQADRVEDALADYAHAARLSPRLIDAWSGQALALARLGRRSEAIAANRAALALAPNDFITHRNLALLYRDTGQPTLALAEARAALAVAPADGRAALEQFIDALHPEAAASD